MPNGSGTAVVDLLILALGPIGAGKVVQQLVAWLTDAAPDKLTSDQKFYLAILVSFVVPIAAYGLLVWLGALSFDLAALLWEIGTGYMVSQGFHRTAEKQAKRGRPAGVPLAIVPATAPSAAPGDNTTRDPGAKPGRNHTGPLPASDIIPAPQTEPLDGEQ